MNNKIFLRACLKLASIYSLGIIIIFVGGFFLNSWFDKILAESSVDPLLHIAELLTVILIVALSYYFAGRTLRPIEDSYERQKKFVADAAHELRTPLAVMKTGAEAILLGRSTKAEYQKLTRESLEEIDHMSSMVNDLLFLAENDYSQKIAFQRVNLLALVHKQVKLMMPYAISKKVDLNENIKDTGFILGNEANLKRLVFNLLQNAIDYNKPGGIVSVSLHKKKRNVTFTIADTGIGIARNELDYIFDRFYKVHNGLSRHSGGTGLGLSIVQEIVKAHQGTITVQSQPSNGTVVTVVFPADQLFTESSS